MTRIYQFADIHFGSENPDAVAAALEVTHADPPNLVVISGDVTQRGKRSEFRDARRWISALDVETIVVPGNHDTPMLNLIARMSDAFSRFDDLFGGIADHVDAGRTQVYGLNTARGWQVRRNWAEGSVNMEDLDVILARAETTPECHHVLVCHHPFISPPDAPLNIATRRGRRASRALAASPVSLLLTGHVHTPSVHRIGTEDASYLAVSAGTLSTRLRQHPPSFNEIIIDRGEIEVIERRFEKGKFQSRHARAFTTAA